MHEYGHTFDSQIFGLSYLNAVGIMSLLSASNSTYDALTGLSSHDTFWSERRANRHAARYFNKYYDVDWNRFEPPFDTYPR